MSAVAYCRRLSALFSSLLFSSSPQQQQQHFVCETLTLSLMATSSSSSELPVVVIGAGIAGLYCAELLSDAGIPVVVVEGATFIGFVCNLLGRRRRLALTCPAASRCSGRIKSVRFVDWGWKLCDVGADFVHGSKTVLKKYVDKLVRRVLARAREGAMQLGRTLARLRHRAHGHGRTVDSIQGLPCRKLFTWAQGDGKAQKWHIGGGTSDDDGSPRSTTRLIVRARACLCVYVQVPRCTTSVVKRSWFASMFLTRS